MEIKKIFSPSYKFGLFSFSIDPEWIEGLEFTNSEDISYKSWAEFKGKNVQIVPIGQIFHKIRDKDVSIFHDGENAEGIALTARERVLNIFSGFESGSKIKPIILYREDNVDECCNLFKVSDGCHRIHCSIVYGYKNIPAVVYKRSELYV